MNEQTQQAKSNLNTFVGTFLMAALLVGLILSGPLGVNALTLVVAVLVVIFLLTYVLPPVKNLFFWAGAVLGALVVILVPGVSPANLTPVQLVLVVLLTLRMR